MNPGSLLRKLLLWLNLFAAAALGLAASAYFIDPNTLLFPSFFGLLAMPIALVNTVCAVFWLLVKPKYTVVSAAALLICSPFLAWQFNLTGSQPTRVPSDLSVMTYNVRLFDLYSWESNTETRNKMVRYLRDADVGIYCLQEYFKSNDTNYFSTLPRLRRALPGIHVHEEFTAVIHSGRHQFGIATLSRYPIVGSGRVPLDTAAHNIAIYTDVLVNADTIRVFNLHLASIYLSELSDSIDQHISQNLRQRQWDDLKAVVSRLAGGFKRRARQAQIIEQYIADSPHPTIVCGDLNDTPGSYAYGAIKGSQRDAFAEMGFGLGSSYIGYYPSLRIDAIFYDERLQLQRFVTDTAEYSDHRPLIASFSLAP